MSNNGSNSQDYPQLNIKAAIAQGFIGEDEEVTIVTVAQLNYLCEQVATLRAELAPLIALFNELKNSPMAAMLPGAGGAFTGGKGGPILPPGVRL